MAIEDLSQEKEIDGVVYKSQPVRSKQGIKALMRLIRIISPIFSAALREGGKAASFAAALEALPIALTDADVEYFAELFGSASWFAGSAENGQGEWVPLVCTAKQNNQDEHWAGRYLAFMRWLVFNVEVNFGGFFDGVAGKNGDIEKLIKTVTGESKESGGKTGSSGG